MTGFRIKAVAPVSVGMVKLRVRVNAQGIAAAVLDTDNIPVGIVNILPVEIAVGIRDRGDVAQGVVVKIIIIVVADGRSVQTFAQQLFIYLIKPFTHKTLNGSLIKNNKC